jgi:hypothetical protein
MFLRNLFDVEVLFGDDELDEWNTSVYPGNPEMHIVGWPMEYMKDILAPFDNVAKKDKIIFPHRLAPEKQVEIFRDLAASMPEYEWFVAQDHTLTKDEYHQHLAESKIVFSANLQETLGISVYEGAIVGTYPMVPDRLSYKEMWNPWFKYTSKYTSNWDSYQENKQQLVDRIRNIMGANGEEFFNWTKDMAMEQTDRFFNGTKLYEIIKNG